MDILSSNANNANGNRSNIESQQQQLVEGVPPFDGNFSSSLDLLIGLQLRQQQEQRRGQPLNCHRDFCTMPAVSSGTGAPISSPGPPVQFCHPSHDSHNLYNNPSIAVNDGNDAGFCSYLELPMLLELKREWTERALRHSASTLLYNDALVSLSLAHFPQSSFTNVIGAQQLSGSTLAPLPSSTSYHSAPCSRAEVVSASTDRDVLPRARGLVDFVRATPFHHGDAREALLVSTNDAAGAVGYSTLTENDEQVGPSKTSEMTILKKYPLKAPKEETKSHLKSKSLPSVLVNRERRRYNAESFAQKLFRLITDQERAGNTQVVEFLDGGGGFWLRQPDAISKLMPKYNFRGNKFSGFRRQLYSYGFRIEKHGPNKGAYKHPSFSRGNAELCMQIKRDNRYDFGPYDLDSCDESDKSDGLEVIDDGMS